MRSLCCPCVYVSLECLNQSYETWYVCYGTWAQLNIALHKFLPSVRVPLFLSPLQSFARQRLAKHVPAATSACNSRWIVGRVVFYAVYVVSKGNMLSVLPRTSSFRIHFLIIYVSTPTWYCSWDFCNHNLACVSHFLIRPVYRDHYIFLEFVNFSISGDNMSTLFHLKLPSMHFVWYTPYCSYEIKINKQSQSTTTIFYVSYISKVLLLKHRAYILGIHVITEE
jgi:hypothetical protein